MHTLPNINEHISGVRKDTIDLMEKRIRAIESTYLAHGLLVGEGIILPAYRWDLEDGVFEVDMKQLPAIRRALGRLKLVNKYAVEDTKKEIWVYLKLVDPQFEHLSFKYKAILPKGSKCRVVRQCRRYSALVCGN